jgi:hypothetical protein
MKEVTSYKANDGKIFEDLIECMRHEVIEKARSSIDAWISQYETMSGILIKEEMYIMLLRFSKEFEEILHVYNKEMK